MTLDQLAAALCGWVAACLFALQAFGHPKHDRWMSMPTYVRVGLILTGSMFAMRSVNFLTLPPVERGALGHINGEGLIALAALSYTVTALAVWSGVFKRLPAQGWFRVQWVEREVRAGRVPVMAEPGEAERLVEQIALSKGVTINTKDAQDKPAVPPELMH